MLLLDVVMVFRRNVPRWARVFDDDKDKSDWVSAGTVLEVEGQRVREAVKLHGMNV